MINKIEESGNSVNEAWQKLNSKIANIAKTETIIFKDIKKYGNFETGYKIVFEYEIKDS